MVSDQPPDKPCGRQIGNDADDGYAAAFGQRVITNDDLQRVLCERIERKLVRITTIQTSGKRGKHGPERDKPGGRELQAERMLKCLVSAIVRSYRLNCAGRARRCRSSGTSRMTMPIMVSMDEAEARRSSGCRCRPG